MTTRHCKTLQNLRWAVVSSPYGGNMTKLCDLHTHSTYSDGTFTPAELIAGGEAAGLSAIALCDHNTVAGLPEFLQAAKGSSVEAIPGVEFSTEYRSRELHILALDVRPEQYEEINSLLRQFLQRKDESNRSLVERLKQAGILLDYEKIRKQAAGSINRAVIGAEMVRLGYCKSVQQAFGDWLSPKRGFYVPPLRPDAFQTVAFIKSIGAIPVLAHPFLALKAGELQEFLMPAKALGLVGMEVYYSLYDEETTAVSCRMAEQLGILKSGGSDFHGGNKPDIFLGVGKGNLQIPLAFWEKLKNR